MSENNALAEKQNEFNTKQARMGKLWELAGPDKDLSRKEVLDHTSAKDATHAYEIMRSWNNELVALAGDLRTANANAMEAGYKALMSESRAPVLTAGHPGTTLELKSRSFGEMVIQSKAFTMGDLKAREGVSLSVDIGLKTLFETAAGFAPESVRSGLVVPAAGARISFLDIMPVREIRQAVDKFMAQTTLTNNSAEKAEGVAYAESVFVYTEQESPIRKITNSIPVTDEQLEDAPEVVPILNGDVTRGLRERLELQTLVGDGTAPNIEGFLDAGRTDVQTTAKGANPVFDAVFTAMNLVRTTGDANPTHIVFNPANWLAVRLARTADGQYIMGSPIVAGAETLFGLPVILSTRITSGTALTGDFLGYSYIANRRGIDVQVGYSGTQFAEGKKLIRADLRAGLTVTREAAFCKITGLA